MSRYRDAEESEDFESAGLTIGEMARRSGLTVAGLRNWELRYGVPVPHRSPSGQRRYSEDDLRLVARILELREGGLSLAAAVERARSDAHQVRETSLYAGLRRMEPGLAVHKMDKKTLLALTWAIEDQCCATAQVPILFAAFQQRRYYRPAQRRWESMAATAEQTVVFADFDHSQVRPGPLAEIRITADSPLQREWALICDSVDLPACVLGWEPPGQEDRPDADRTFEAIWSVEPKVVRQAARIGLDLASQSLPDISEPSGGRLAVAARSASPDLVRATGIFERALDYMARV